MQVVVKTRPVYLLMWRSNEYSVEVIRGSVNKDSKSGKNKLNTSAQTRESPCFASYSAWDSQHTSLYRYSTVLEDQRDEWMDG